MDASSIRSEVINRLAIECEGRFDKIEVDHDLRRDLGLDSLQSMELVLNLESVFDIEISDEEIQALETVGDVVRLVEEKKAAS